MINLSLLKVFYTFTCFGRKKAILLNYMTSKILVLEMLVFLNLIIILVQQLSRDF